MSTQGGKGGATQAPGNVANRDYGSQANAANAGLHNQLSDQFGYSGQFGGGAWGDWASQNLSPAQRQQASQMEQQWNNPQQNNLATGVMQGLQGAADQTRQWMDYQPEQLSTIDRQPYMNPYQQDVIDTTMGEMNRQYGLQQTGLGDQAIGAGAFGGDRHGIAQAEMARNQMDQSQNWLAGLNNQNFQQATQQGMFDIGNQFQNKQMGMGGANQLGGLANMGFGMGAALQGMQRQAGMDQFNMQQALIDRQRQQWQDYQNQPYQNLQAWQQGMPNMSGMGSTEQGSNMGAAGLIGGGLQIASLFCWVAREVYGADSSKWVDFRNWMMTDAPNWLFKLYARHGENFAGTVKRRPWLKRILRPAMDLVTQ